MNNCYSYKILLPEGKTGINSQASFLIHQMTATTYQKSSLTPYYLVLPANNSASTSVFFVFVSEVYLTKNENRFSANFYFQIGLSVSVVD